MADIDLNGLIVARRKMAVLVWVCAVITMATSALTGYWTFTALAGGVGVLGLLTGCSVDLGLCIGLIGDRQLNAHGLASPYGRALRWVCGAMSVLLNCGAALIDSHWFLALLHAFIPVVLVVVTEYGQSCSLGYTRLHREGELAHETAARQAAEQERLRIDHETALAREKAEHDRRTAELARERVRAAALRELASAPAPSGLSLVPNPQPATRPSVTAPRPSPVRTKAVAWLAAQALAGRDVTAISYRELATEAGLKLDTCKKGLPNWLAEVVESEVAVG